MATKSGIQQKKLVQVAQENPESDAAEIVVKAAEQPKITQILVTLGENVHRSLRQYAEDEGTTQDIAAAGLIEDALSQKGYVEGAEE
jgi:hypothetical protein